MSNIIEIDHLYKSFGDVKAVQDLSFRVKEGELFAFLGVNGAGKSTTINILCNQLPKDSGTVSVCGVDLDENPDRVKRDIGVVFQNSVLDKDLSVRDEPTTGLDPQTRNTLWQVIGKLRRQEKMTVFLTTHYMEEAADADYVVILDSGKIAAEGTPLALKNAYTGDFITIYGVEEKEIRKLNAPYESIRDAYRVSVPDPAAATELILKYPEIFRDYELTKGKMDDVFLAATGKKLAGGEEK